jgi:hypothetical protein
MSTSAAAHQPVFNGGGIGLTIVFEDDAAEAALVEDVEEFLGQAGTVIVWAEGTAVEACGTVVSGGAVVDGGGQRQQQWRSSVGFREFGGADGDDGACTAVGGLVRRLPTSQVAMHRGRWFGGVRLRAGSKRRLCFFWLR